MKNILEAPYIKELCATCSNMYRLGWDERNGGNISYLLKEEELTDYLDVHQVIRTIPTGFTAEELEGKYFLVTGTGKYFKNVEKDPSNSLGIIHLVDDGKTAELLWGFEDGGKFTSEFPAHMMSHVSRLSIDPENRVVAHCHPDNLLAMSYILPLEDKVFTRELWQMETECIVVFPEGIGVLPWMLCGTNKIGVSTAAKMLEYRLVLWSMHGIYGAGKTLDEAFGLIETVEKAAHIYMLTVNCKRINTITKENLIELADFFKVNYRKEFLED